LELKPEKGVLIVTNVEDKSIRDSNILKRSLERIEKVNKMPV